MIKFRKLEALKKKREASIKFMRLEKNQHNVIKNTYFDD